MSTCRVIESSCRHALFLRDDEGNHLYPDVIWTCYKSHPLISRDVVKIKVRTKKEKKKERGGGRRKRFARHIYPKRG